MGAPAWTRGDGRWGMGHGVVEGKGASCMGRGRGHKGTGVGGHPSTPKSPPVPSPTALSRPCPPAAAAAEMAAVLSPQCRHPWRCPLLPAAAPRPAAGPAGAAREPPQGHGLRQRRAPRYTGRGAGGARPCRGEERREVGTAWQQQCGRARVRKGGAAGLHSMIVFG